jgi:hypothetical protein
MAEFELPEKARSHHERIVGLIIAAIAVVLAIVSSAGHQAHSDEIVAHVDAADQYAFYQAKKDRSFALQLQIDSIHLQRDQLSPAAQAQADKLLSDDVAQQVKLTFDGKDIQGKGQAFLDEADRLARKAQILDVGEIALQISIVLCSITILTEQRLFAILGVLTAGIGMAVGLWGIVTG